MCFASENCVCGREKVKHENVRFKMKTLIEKVEESVQFVPNKSAKDAKTFIWDCLEQLGITNDDIGHELLMSNDCKEGDFRQVFCDKMRLPVPRFRRIWRILKDGTVEESHKESEGLTKDVLNRITPIGQWSDEQLLEKYSPVCDRAVETELKARSELRPCIIFKFKSKDEIDVELSLKLLREARRREVPNVYKSEGKTYKVYRVGEFPEDTYTRCPVTGSLLFENYSEKIGVKWEMPYDALQFVALLVNNGVDVTAMVARELQKEYKDRGLDGLKDLFPKIGVQYEELKEINELPNLKATLNSRDAKMDPFGKRY